MDTRKFFTDFRYSLNSKKYLYNLLLKELSTKNPLFIGMFLAKKNLIPFLQKMKYLNSIT